MIYEMKFTLFLRVVINPKLLTSGERGDINKQNINLVLCCIIFSSIKLILCISKEIIMFTSTLKKINRDLNLLHRVHLFLDKS